MAMILRVLGTATPYPYPPTPRQLDPRRLDAVWVSLIVEIGCDAMSPTGMPCSSGRVMHHSGEIGLLRDLYSATGGAPAWR